MAATEGWSNLLNAPKAHYFRRRTSLCGRWMAPFMDEFVQGHETDDDNCKACMKRRAKELASKENSNAR